ncbi:hypothetical protein [Geobacter sp. SVR]|uniref:hypothetical protein n=1 Tax=Geobacter sp. SVR TaxID=2495594 RepID=UPI00143EFC25|nr:hypothetical protein [Geobacter sp. SVR]BCS52114.1 hypothetical protein GSVR_04220 [Geobacter sp. SVR]GCF86569.1 hypothetical protein GSbR_31690 [Geobacter sp. SVR]
MKRYSDAIWRLLSSRLLTPLVIGLFLLLYIAIAFRTEDALMALITVTRSTPLLIALFALIPLNRLLRLIQEIRDHFALQRLIRGISSDFRPELFDEAVEMEGSAVPFADVGRRLTASGYTISEKGTILSAWRGIGIFPARFMFLGATALLFCGILLSLGGRMSYRATLIEGEPLPVKEGEPAGGLVGIILTEENGLFLGKKLAIEVSPQGDRQAKRIFGLYPPARWRGSFVYPRYLGIGLYYRLSAPDLPDAYGAHDVLSIHPAGKEDSRQVPGTLYRLVFSLAQPDDGSDPYVTGRMTVRFKLLKGAELLFEGSAPRGGSFSRDGYHLEFPDIRRLVITDFIHDHGVMLIWSAMALYTAALLFWLFVCLACPRREIVFVRDGDKVLTASRAEGRRRKHVGVFHEALDML